MTTQSTYMGSGVAPAASTVTTSTAGFNGNLTTSETTVQLALDKLDNMTVGTAVTSGKLSQFAATTSTELAGVISDETGSGKLVFATAPTLQTPVRVEYDTNNYFTQTVSSAGAVTLDATGSSAGFTVSDPLYASGGLVLPKTSGTGIKVDPAAPTFGWADITGDANTRTTGAAVPSFGLYRGTIYGFYFSNAATQEMFFTFHWPHDYVPGSDVYIHAHWSQNVVDTGGAASAPGVVKWYWDVTWAKGYDQAAFATTVTTSVTQTASSTQYQHMIAEVQLSAASPSANQLDSDNFEVDGLLLVRLYRNPDDAADTLNQTPFLHTCDIHYQTTGYLGTKGRNGPGFYT